MIGRWIAAVRIWKATRRYAAGDLAGARGQVARALEAQPDLSLADQYLGVLSLKGGDPRDAEERLRKAEGSGGDPFVVAQGLGALEILRKRYREGEERFAQAFEAFPVAFEVRYHIGLARLLAGDEPGAMAEFVDLLGREDEPLFKRLGHLAGLE